nr:MAG TPA: hypothetical protein [Caudoviricetes sp.]
MQVTTAAFCPGFICKIWKNLVGVSPTRRETLPGKKPRAA